MVNNIKNIGKGILDNLEALEETGQTKADSKESKRVITEKSKSVKEEKSKRSFMLTASQIEKIYLLKVKFPNRDLSEMVGQSIEEFYNKNCK